MNTTSESLLKRLQSGSVCADVRDTAWSRFVDLYSPLVFFWARKSGLKSQDAADLVQDVMTIVFQKLPGFQYDPTGSFRGWLRAITLNTYRQLLRKKKINEVDTSNSFLGLLVDEKQAETNFDLNYARELVANATNMMRKDFEPTTWLALKAVLTSGMTVNEVAEETGVSIWTIYSARSRLLGRLRTELDGLLD
ncbi:MAG: sigma-70 family RNA polymerase sigma factor [Planctomycetota bacterium]